MTTILTEVQKERQRQNDKWGVQNHNVVEWMAILMEEVGEASKEAVDYHFNNPPKTHLETDLAESKNNLLQYNRLMNYRKECIQIAAVAVQMIECLDRQTKGDFIP